MAVARMVESEPCRIGQVACDVLRRLGPACERYDSLAESWYQLLPSNLRAHCRVAGARDGCLTVVTDGSSYLYELQLCKEALLDQLQRRCPASRISRLDIRMAH